MDVDFQGVILIFNIKRTDCKPLLGSIQIMLRDEQELGHGFAPRLGPTKDHHGIGTYCLPAWHAGIKMGVWKCTTTVLRHGSVLDCLGHAL